MQNQTKKSLSLLYSPCSPLTHSSGTQCPASFNLLSVSLEFNELFFWALRTYCCHRKKKRKKTHDVMWTDRRKKHRWWGVLQGVGKGARNGNQSILGEISTIGFGLLIIPWGSGQKTVGGAYFTLHMGVPFEQSTLIHAQDQACILWSCEKSNINVIILCPQVYTP